MNMGVTILGVLLALVAAVTARGETNDVVRHLRLGYTLQNSGGACVPLAELYVRAPLRETPWQRGASPTATRPFELLAASDGSQILRFVFTNLPPFACEIIWVDVDVTLAAAPSPGAVPADDALRAASAPFDYHDAAFAPALRAITGRVAPPPSEIIRRVAAWSGTQVKARAYSGGQREALAVLRDGGGDCSERMALIVALCRRAGLAARGVGGVVTERDRVVHASDYHDWAVAHDGATWQLADPGAAPGGDWRRYVAFEWIDGGTPPTDFVRRYRATGAGVVARME